MAMSVSIVAVVTALHLIAFVFAVGAERRRSTAKVVPDQYDEMTYCVYSTDASTVYGLSAFGLLLISQAVVNGVTRCLCFGKGLVTGTSSTTWAVFFFIVSWVSFLGAEACLLAGSARNAYHTKYRKIFGGGSILYYWAHTRADTGGWEKHRNEGLGMAMQQQQPGNEFEKA
ncbi:hypothetical protein CICLE_v10016804mg [Citrus x clementina]|uniref:Aerobic coproporphyrinogen-III oxidase (DUF1218) n=2 Tax=Citrus TaxID=2706 RepID=A0ACB8NA64_CITSI|nr:hypothetical protein CICLE_v10016804mg [Citrus x clementina]KAH9795048.1 Aerobic coproporphyrinogen-III oxidase (DUF1218) [Citrus sinensis]